MMPSSSENDRIAGNGNGQQAEELRHLDERHLREVDCARMHRQHLRPIVTEEDAEIAPIRCIAGQRHDAGARSARVRSGIDRCACVRPRHRLFVRSAFTVDIPPVPRSTRSPGASSAAGTRNVTPCHDVSDGTTTRSATTHSSSRAPWPITTSSHNT
jgi:hypothetical protein